MGDLGLIPGLRRSPGEGKDYPLQYSGLENSMDCIVHRVTKSQTRLSDFHFHFLTHFLSENGVWGEASTGSCPKPNSLHCTHLFRVSVSSSPNLRKLEESDPPQIFSFPFPSSLFSSPGSQGPDRCPKLLSKPRGNDSKTTGWLDAVMVARMAVASPSSHCSCCLIVRTQLALPRDQSWSQQLRVCEPLVS